MTKRATLEALLARVLERSGPDRELDARIYILITGGSADDADYAATDPDVTCNPPPFTASLDAALTLVPTKPVPNLRPGTWWWMLEVWPEEVNASVHYENGDSAIIEERASADTPARALIAACLKARMEVQGD